MKSLYLDILLQTIKGNKLQHSIYQNTGNYKQLKFWFGSSHDFPGIFLKLADHETKKIITTFQIIQRKRDEDKTCLRQAMISSRALCWTAASFPFSRTSFCSVRLGHLLKPGKFQILAHLPSVHLSEREGLVQHRLLSLPDRQWVHDSLGCRGSGTLRSIAVHSSSSPPPGGRHS